MNDDAMPQGLTGVEAHLLQVLATPPSVPGWWRIERLIQESELFDLPRPDIVYHRPGQVDLHGQKLYLADWPAHHLSFEWSTAEEDPNPTVIEPVGTDNLPAPSDTGTTPSTASSPAAPPPAPSAPVPSAAPSAPVPSAARPPSPGPALPPSTPAPGVPPASPSPGAQAFGPDETLPADLGDAALLDSIVTGARTISRDHARQFLRVNELAHRRAGTAVTELPGRPAHGEAAISIGAQAVADELALELTLSRWNAEKLVFTAVGLCLEAPEILNALTHGDLDLARAEVILDYTHSLITATQNDDPDGADPHQLARDLQDTLLKAAKTKTTSELKKTAEDTLIRINPAAAERRHATKRTRRHLRLIPDTDGMCWVSAYLPADQGVKIFAALKALAEASWTDNDPRTLDQASVDALYDIILTALHTYGGTDVEHHCTHPDHHHNHTTTDRMPGEDPGSAGHQPGGAGPSRRRRETGASGRTRPKGAAGQQERDSRCDRAGESDRTGQEDWVGEPDRACRHRAGWEDEVRQRSHPSSEDRCGSSDTATGSDGLHLDEPQPTEVRPEPTEPERCDRPDLEQRHLPETARATNGSEAPARTGRFRRPKADTQVLLTISADTLTGATDDPGHLGGYGPVVASMARTVAATGTWRCALVDATHGTLAGLGTSTYSPKYAPTAQLRRHLIARDSHCRWPGCTRPARRCDVDHVRPYDNGGPTCECNCELLCPHHHRLCECNIRIWDKSIAETLKPLLSRLIGVT